MSKRILLTGTSASFGLGASKSLAAAGHTVFATMRGTAAKNVEMAQQLHNEAAATTGTSTSSRST